MMSSCKSGLCFLILLSSAATGLRLVDDEKNRPIEALDEIEILIPRTPEPDPHVESARALVHALKEEDPDKLIELLQGNEVKSVQLSEDASGSKILKALQDSDLFDHKDLFKKQLALQADDILVDSVEVEDPGLYTTTHGKGLMLGAAVDCSSVENQNYTLVGCKCTATYTDASGNKASFEGCGDGVWMGPCTGSFTTDGVGQHTDGTAVSGFCNVSKWTCFGKTSNLIALDTVGPKANGMMGKSGNTFYFNSTGHINIPLTQNGPASNTWIERHECPYSNGTLDGSLQPSGSFAATGTKTTGCHFAKAKVQAVCRKRFTGVMKMRTSVPWAGLACDETTIEECGNTMTQILEPGATFATCVGKAGCNTTNPCSSAPYSCSESHTGNCYDCLGGPISAYPKNGGKPGSGAEFALGIAAGQAPIQSTLDYSGPTPIYGRRVWVSHIPVGGAVINDNQGPNGHWGVEWRSMFWDGVYHHHGGNQVKGTTRPPLPAGTAQGMMYQVDNPLNTQKLANSNGALDTNQLISSTSNLSATFWGYGYVYVNLNSPTFEWAIKATCPDGYLAVSCGCRSHTGLCSQESVAIDPGHPIGPLVDSQPFAPEADLKTCKINTRGKKGHTGIGDLAGVYAACTPEDMYTTMLMAGSVDLNQNLRRLEKFISITKSGRRARDATVKFINKRFKRTRGVQLQSMRRIRIVGKK